MKSLIEIKRKTWTFRVHLRSALLAFCFLSFLVSLGFWQLHRADEKRTLLGDFHERSLHAPVSLPVLLEKKGDLRYQSVRLKGHYDVTRQLLLDHRFYQHRPGYQVLSLFIPAHGKKAVWVNEGWVPHGTSPALLRQNGRFRTIEGVVYQPSPPFLLKDTPIAADAEWPLVVQAIQMKKFEQVVHRPLYSWILLLSPASKSGFIREWRPVALISPAKHVGYAVQWFSFALVGLIVFVVVNLKRGNS